MSFLPPFTILGEVPNGGPGPDTAPALRTAIPPEQVEAVLRTARDVILSATGPRDGIASTIDVRRFDQAIRVYMPLGHYERSPNQAISVMDYKMYACRVVHRLLNQIAGTRIALAGAYTSHLATNARANALYEALGDFKQRGTQAPATSVGRVSSYLGRDTTHGISSPPPSSALVTLPTLPDFTFANGSVVTGALAVAAHVATFALAVFEKSADLPLPVSTFDPEIHAIGKNPTAQRRAERAGAHAETHLLASGFMGRLAGNWSSGEMVRVRARAILAAVESLAGGRSQATRQAALPEVRVPLAVAAPGFFPHPPPIQAAGSSAQAEHEAQEDIEQRIRREVQAAERRARDESERLRRESEVALQRARDAEQRLERERAEARAREEAEGARGAAAEAGRIEDERKRDAERAALESLARDAEARLAQSWAREDVQQAARGEIEQKLRRELAEELEQRVRTEIEQRLRQELALRTNSGEAASTRDSYLPAVEQHPSWAASLADPGARTVFLHLAAHGSVTETEVIGFLGSPRAYRRFSLEFEQHVQSVPFRVRIEPAADGKRYVKEGEI